MIRRIHQWWGRLACNKLGWHKAPIAQTFDGCSYYGDCPRCGHRVLQDSQGNWFSVGTQETIEE